jgi:hypothetical protein
MICKLCGKELKRKKGENQKAHVYELQRGAHVVCLIAHENILRKYHISQNDYLNAVIEGMFLLFPELGETKTMRDYQSRMRKAEEEIEAAFPHLKKKEGEKKVEEKKQGVEKEEK